MKIRIALAFAAIPLLANCASTDAPTAPQRMLRTADFAGEAGSADGQVSPLRTEQALAEMAMANSYGASKPVRIYWFLGAR